MARRRGERAVRPRLPGAGLGGAFFFFSQFPLAGSRKPGAAGRSGPRCSSSSSRSRPGAAAAAAAEAAAGGVEPPWPPLLRKKPAQLLCADPRAPVPAPRPPRLYPIASTPASASANFHAASAARPGSTPMGEWWAAGAWVPGCPGAHLSLGAARLSQDCGAGEGAPGAGHRRVTQRWAPCLPRAPPFTPTRAHVPAKPARR